MVRIAHTASTTRMPRAAVAKKLKKTYRACRPRRGATSRAACRRWTRLCQVWGAAQSVGWCGVGQRVSGDVEVCHVRRAANGPDCARYGAAQSVAGVRMAAAEHAAREYGAGGQAVFDPLEFLSVMHAASLFPHFLHTICSACTSRFSTPGEGCVLLVDSGRFLPASVTISKVVASVWSSEKRQLTPGYYEVWMTRGV
eukprot:364478-Chlamydomonas_euryale.AAC.15